MPTFAYRAVDRSGKRQEGYQKATSAAALSRTFEERGLLLLEVEASEQTAVDNQGFPWSRKQEVLEVTRALAAFLSAGMPLARAFSVAGELAGRNLAEPLADIRDQVRRGELLHVALSAYPALFPPMYSGIVRAGERSGDLPAAFRRLAEQLEREAEIRNRLLSASIYPFLLALVGGAALVVLLAFVLPRFVELLEGAGAVIPPSTSLLLESAAFLGSFWLPILLLLFGGIMGAFAFSRTTHGQRAGARLLLLLPMSGQLRRNALAARFARLTGVILNGGAPLMTALENAVDSFADPIAREEVERIRDRVREGVRLEHAIADGLLFPPMLRQLIAVGEGSGRLAEFLLKSAEILEERVHRSLERLVILVEPALIILFGLIVGFVALALLQAIYGIDAGAF